MKKSTVVTGSVDRAIEIAWAKGYVRPAAPKPVEDWKNYYCSSIKNGWSE